MDAEVEDAAAPSGPNVKPLVKELVAGLKEGGELTVGTIVVTD